MNIKDTEEYKSSIKLLNKITMNKEFVPYEIALELKELGFNEPCLGHYQQEWHDDGMTELEPSLQMIISKQHQHTYQLCTTPLFSQVFRWFRENYNLHVNKTGNNHYTSFNMTEPKIEVLSFVRYTDTENHYEEAELACLKKLIGIVKNK